ncbi:glucosidase family protein [Paenibacillus roseipurpureus]|uniref:Glycosyl-hydrolase family 116 catalytic region domain-containing protein n=1 Tax=Paenibacillus roseopurpureus TaxID=2918901 RepID=A0AA96LPT0_9BACL|nr:hypothetical protein [Paenibacillus sp. MBLB1832]WNR42670.1 hypothetical protein MJB10_16270 [Paenibacillus sp. MBLB1832]
MQAPKKGSSHAEQGTRWQISDDGGIRWDIQPGDAAHEDHIEMSGQEISLIVRYGIDAEGCLRIVRRAVWPHLRTIPNDTHASLIEDFHGECRPEIRAEGVLIEEKPYRISFNGILELESQAGAGLRIRRSIFPARYIPYGLERVHIQNESPDGIAIEIAQSDVTRYRRGTKGIYVVSAGHDARRACELGPGESISYTSWVCAMTLQRFQPKLEALAEEALRRQFVNELGASLTLETPEPVLNRMFGLAKIRAAESVFRTRSGLLHGPGGGSYYAAVWTNDQAEYAGPFFPFLGDQAALEASLNAYRLYMPFMGPDLYPIPSSIIAEGLDIWEGAGDRGDAAMYAYGAARFALASGSRLMAEELWPAITWCLAFCRKKRTTDGVIASDSDELENRFPSGEANLCTSSLTYGALQSAAQLARELGKGALATEFEAEAASLRQAIETYFGATVEGYETYRYYEGNDILRAWICVPLTMGIFERKDQTIAALVSNRLWVGGGLVTQAGETTYWDRSTLYALRGILFAGETELGMKKLMEYANNRLLGDHVPYAVEAYPEGNQRHLSAESALFARVITEGLFGIVPMGLRSFTCCPRLPQGWNTMALRAIQAFGTCVDLVVTRQGDLVNVDCRTPDKWESHKWDQTVPLFICV